MSGATNGIKFAAAPMVFYDAQRTDRKHGPMFTIEPFLENREEFDGSRISRRNFPRRRYS